MRATTLLIWVWIGALVGFLVMPIFMVVLFSFGNNAMIAFPLGGLTLKWYGALLDWAAFWGALQNSLTVASGVAVVSTAIGTMAALAMARLRENVATGFGLAMSIPVMLPGLVIGIALLAFYVTVGLKLSLLTVFLSHLMVTQPYVILIVYARMSAFDYAVIDSARDLGATPLRAFVTVTLPIIRTAVVGAALLAVSHSLDDFIVTFFTIGAGNTLPTLVWGTLRTTLDPRVNAIATLLIVTTVGSTAIALRLSRYRG